MAATGTREAAPRYPSLRDYRESFRIFMTLIRFLPFLLLPLAACGTSETPQPAPGAVERLTAELDRNDTAERNATARRIDREAEARQASFERRIAAIEREEARP